MPELEFPTEKPFAGVRRERHDGTNGRAALHGHTARMASCDSIDGAAELKRQLPRCRNHDYLDKDKAYGTPSSSRLAEPYALTALELEHPPGEWLRLVVTFGGDAVVASRGGYAVWWFRLVVTTTCMSPLGSNGHA